MQKEQRREALLAIQRQEEPAVVLLHAPVNEVKVERERRIVGGQQQRRLERLEESVANFLC